MYNQFPLEVFGSYVSPGRHDEAQVLRCLSLDATGRQRREWVNKGWGSSHRWEPNLKPSAIFQISPEKSDHDQGPDNNSSLGNQT